MRLLVVLAATISPALAFWRLPCRGRVGLGPIDPIVNPGKRAGHVHALHGAGNLGLTNTYQQLRESECTSCEVLEDMSLYWAPALYYEHTDKSTEVVKQVGGMLIYYLQRNDSPSEKVHAFPAGLRMVAGSNFQRNFTKEQKNIGFTCLNYDKNPGAYPIPHTFPDRNFIDTYCKHGIRSEVFFPSCWDGKRVDSANHKDHMAYPSRIDSGACPPGYPVRLISLFYETIWDTSAFKGKPGRFVFSNGDPTGYGYHGDFMNGWEEKFLQKAVDECNSASGVIQDCKQFTLQKDSAQDKCKMRTPAIMEGETFNRRERGLPENVPISEGPGYAKPGTPPTDPDTPPKDPDTPPKDPDTPPKDPDTPPKDPDTTTTKTGEQPSYPTQSPPPTETKPPVGKDPDTNEPPTDDEPGSEPPTDDEPSDDDDDEGCEPPTNEYPQNPPPTETPTADPTDYPTDPKPTDGSGPSPTQDSSATPPPYVTDAPDDDGECPSGEIVSTSWSTNGNSVYKINYVQTVVVTTISATETDVPQADSRKREHVQMHNRHIHRH
ncbi:hypothetical protein ACJ72_02649 [Emergomyces africanus]|uniref:DUF1996 domain-containing protein n=1 Tax=Emergomyces africanus TaxID=1955775 RepID=A0A1B7P1T7_9EURO|nr:hypothetical protein ACJ72_02649 [Emergomyces africanus]